MNEIKTSEQPLNKLFERLNILNGLLKHLENQLQIFQSSMHLIATGKKPDSNNLFAGFVLGVRDLTLRPAEHSYIYGYYPTGKFVTEGQEFIKLADLLVVREAAWTIAQAFETFETYLRNVYAYYLFSHQTAVEEKKYNKKHNELAKLNLKPEQVEYWERFVRIARYENTEILRLIREQFSGLEISEKENSYGIDLAEWFQVVTEVRHSVTHSNMLIKAEIITEWSPQKVAISKDFFNIEATLDGYKVSPSVKQAEINLQLFAGYAYVLHKILNDLRGNISDILAKP
jgi:hypothetical protein